MLPWWKLQFFPSKTVASSFRLVLPLFTSNMVICQYSVNHLPDLQMLYEKGKKTELVFHPNSLNITWRSTDKSGRSRGSIGFWYTVKLNWPYLMVIFMIVLHYGKTVEELCPSWLEQYEVITAPRPVRNATVSGRLRLESNSEHCDQSTSIPKVHFLPVYFCIFSVRGTRNWKG